MDDATARESERVHQSEQKRIKSFFPTFHLLPDEVLMDIFNGKQLHDILF